MTSTQRPRVLFVVDHPRWVLAQWGRELSSRIADVSIEVVSESMLAWRLDTGSRPDLVHWTHPGLWIQHRYRVPAEIPSIIAFHSERSLDAIAEFAAFDSENTTFAGISQRIVDRLREQLQRAYYLPDGLFAEQWPLAKRIQEGPLRIGMVGILTPAKGFQNILMPVARTLGLEIVTHWDPPTPPGRVFPDAKLLPPGHLGRLYGKMDLYAMLSDAEGTPMPLLEAMASGVAPVAVRTGAAEELIEDGRTGFLIDRHPDELRSFLERPDLTREKLREVGLRARERVLRLRDGRLSVGRYRRLYRERLGLGSHPLDVEASLSVAVVIAHPDDETLWAGGMIDALPQHDWTFICATGEPGSPRLEEFETVVRHRAGHSRSLGLPDRWNDESRHHLRERLHRLFAEEELGSFDAVITHGSEGEYGHPQHVMVHEETVAVLRELQEPPLVLGFGTGDADWPISPLASVEKARVLEVYASEDRRIRMTAHAGRWSNTEGLQTYIPGRSLDADIRGAHPTPAPAAPAVIETAEAAPPDERWRTRPPTVLALVPEPSRFLSASPVPMLQRLSSEWTVRFYGPGWPDYDPAASLESILERTFPEALPGWIFLPDHDQIDLPDGVATTPIPKAVWIDDAHHAVVERIRYLRTVAPTRTFFTQWHTSAPYAEFVERPLWLPHGVAPQYAGTSETEGARDIDVTLFGRTDPRIYPFRHRLAHLLPGMADLETKIVPHPGYGQARSDPRTALFDILRRSKVALVDASRYGLLLLRYFEIPAAGAIALGEVPPQYADLLGPLVLPLEPTSTDEQICVAIRRVVEDSETILAPQRQRAREIALTTHTWEARAKVLASSLRPTP